MSSQYCGGFWQHATGELKPAGEAVQKHVIHVKHILALFYPIINIYRFSDIDQKVIWSKVAPFDFFRESSDLFLFFFSPSRSSSSTPPHYLQQGWYIWDKSILSFCTCSSMMHIGSPTVCIKWSFNLIFSIGLSHGEAHRVTRAARK